MELSKKDAKKLQKMQKDIAMWQSSDFVVKQQILRKSGGDDQYKWEVIATSRGFCTLAGDCTCQHCKQSTSTSFGMTDGDEGDASLGFSSPTKCRPPLFESYHAVGGQRRKLMEPYRTSSVAVPAAGHSSTEIGPYIKIGWPSAHPSGWVRVAYIDTGAHMSCVNERMARVAAKKVREIPPTHLSAICGNPLQILGQINVCILINACLWSCDFYVLRGIVHEIVLGQNFLFKYGAQVCFRENKLKLGDVHVKFVPRCTKCQRFLS